MFDPLACFRPDKQYTTEGAVSRAMFLSFMEDESAQSISDHSVPPLCGGEDFPFDTDELTAFSDEEYDSFDEGPYAPSFEYQPDLPEETTEETQVLLSFDRINELIEQTIGSEEHLLQCVGPAVSAAALVLANAPCRPQVIIAAKTKKLRILVRNGEGEGKAFHIHYPCIEREDQSLDRVARVVLAGIAARCICGFIGERGTVYRTERFNVVRVEIAPLA